jgi:hypothetical protein
MTEKVLDKLTKVEELLKEIKSTKQSTDVVKTDTMKQVVDAVYKRVMEQLKNEGIGRIELAPPEYILNKFQEKEVERWEEALRELDEDELKIASFVLSLNKQTTKSEIIAKIFGKQYTSGQAYMDYSKKIDRLIELEIFRTDKAKRIYPNLFEKVSSELKVYNPNEEKIKQVHDRILRIFIKKIEEENEGN